MTFDYPARESAEVARPLRAQARRGSVDEVRTLLSRPPRARDCGGGAMMFEHPWLTLHASESPEGAR
jgi:hypothetical protein